MEIRVTTELFTSFSALTKKEQKRVKETIFSIANRQSNSGLRYHKINHPCNKIFSYSINMDLRVISHQNNNYTTLLYVGHHDDSYKWISKRKFIDTEAAINIIILNENFEEIDNPLTIELHKVKSDKEDLIKQLRDIQDDDTAIEFISDQASEIQDELFEFIIGRSKSHKLIPSHFIKVMNEDEELSKALDSPLEFWRIFLHPSQKNIIDRPISHSTFLTGAPGTGKTVCLVHKIKRFENDLSENECLILTTFKTGLKEYIVRMLRLLNYDKNKTFIDDISALKLHEGTIKSNAKVDGLFQITDNTLYYFKEGKRFKVKHLFFDEFQDFRRGQVNIIKALINKASFTLSFDYSQAIYRNVKNTVHELDPEQRIDLIKLDYSYRINSKILEKLKQVVKIIRVLSHESTRLGDLGLRELEEELIENTTAAIVGAPMVLESYDDNEKLKNHLISDLDELKNDFSQEEIVITSFFSDLYQSLSESESYHIDEFPKSIQQFYKYIPTLKGKEYKAGIVILDDTICQMLNINMSVFIGRVNTEFKGGGANYRLNLNLLYVALSRFRDFLKVYYPAKYEIIIQPVLESDDA